jgi:hypothetical protein
MIAVARKSRKQIHHVLAETRSEGFTCPFPKRFGERPVAFIPAFSSLPSYSLIGVPISFVLIELRYNEISPL